MDKRPAGPPVPEIERLRLPYLLKRFPARAVWALFVFINGFVTMAILGAVAVVSKTPFVFPSLGPTALLLFFNPLTAAASPRSVLFGHGVGIVCGYGALWLLGLTLEPPALVAGVHAQRVICAALSLVSTGALMVLLDVWHPPAGATTLIVSLGIITSPYHLLIIELAVALLVLQAVLINRAAGLEYPIWSFREKR